MMMHHMTKKNKQTRKTYYICDRFCDWTVIDDWWEWVDGQTSLQHFSRSRFWLLHTDHNAIFFNIVVNCAALIKSPHVATLLRRSPPPSNERTKLQVHHVSHTKRATGMFQSLKQILWSPDGSRGSWCTKWVTKLLLWK